MSTENNKSKSPAPRKVTGTVSPFGFEQAEKSAIDLFKESFGVGIADVDRGVQEYDDAADDGKGGYVHTPDVNTECVITFATNEGKGTGAQVVPVSELPEYINALEEIVAADFVRPDGDPDSYQPAGAIARSSWHMVRPRIRVADAKAKAGFKSVEDSTKPKDRLAVRSKNGHGAKPMIIKKSEVPAILGLLKEVAANIESFTDRSWSLYNAEQAKQQEAAQKKAAKSE
jgi:hypothetical protein